MSSFRGRDQKRRGRGDQNWYDKSMATLTADQEEEIVEIPKEKVGLVIGRKGRTKEKITRQTGVQIFIKDDGAHLRGTAEQIHEAKSMIGEILSPVSTHKSKLTLMIENNQPRLYWKLISKAFIESRRHYKSFRQIYISALYSKLNPRTKIF